MHDVTTAVGPRLAKPHQHAPFFEPQRPCRLPCQPAVDGVDAQPEPEPPAYLVPRLIV